MDVLIIFETHEGQTGKIVKHVEQQIRAAGHGVHTFDTADKLAPFSFDGIDKIVLAAPVHERRHPKNFEVTVGASTEELGTVPTLLISVSLKAAFPESLEEAQEYVGEMELRTRFTPDTVALTAGAVRTNSYDYFQSQVVQHVALEGQNVKLIDGEREFTDWNKLDAEVAAFLNG